MPVFFYYQIAIRVIFDLTPWFYKFLEWQTCFWKIFYKIEDVITYGFQFIVFLITVPLFYNLLLLSSH